MPVCQATRNGVFHGLARGFVDDREYLGERFVERFLFAPAGELLGHRVEIGDQAMRVGGDHGVTDGMQGDFEKLFFFKQALFQRFAAAYFLPQLRIRFVEFLCSVPEDQCFLAPADADEQEIHRHGADQCEPGEQLPPKLRPIGIDPAHRPPLR